MSLPWIAFHSAEVARRLAVTAGRKLGWIEDGMGGGREVPHTPETAEALAVQGKIMVEFFKGSESW